MPRAAPWQPPLLQLARRNTGITSRRKETARSLRPSLTATGALAVRPPIWATSSVAPASPAAARLKPSSRATLPSATLSLANAVTSRVVASEKVAKTTTRWRSRRVSSEKEAGRISSFWMEASLAFSSARAVSSALSLALSTTPEVQTAPSATQRRRRSISAAAKGPSFGGMMSS